MAFQLRRGTNAGRLGITPAEGELIYTTDTKALFVGDGTTAGGNAVGGGGGGPDTNTTYTISAETATGGVNLRLAGSDSSTDDVKLAAGANITLTRTSPSEITIAAAGGGGGGGATYTIQADAELDGASITLLGSDLSSDSIKLVEGTNVTITQTDANTIAIDAVTSENEILDFVGPWLENGTNTGITFAYDPLTNSLTSTVSIGLGDLSDVNLGLPADGDIIKYDGLAGNWVLGSADLVNDPSPSLGAPLDLNGQAISGTGNINIAGDFELDGGLTVGGPTNYTGGITVFSQANNTITSPMLSMLNYNSDPATLPLVNMLRGRGTADAPLSSAAGDTIGGFRFAALGSNPGVTPTAAATITAVVDPSGTINTNSTSGALVFQVRNSPTSLISALIINQDGIVKYPSSSTVLPTVVDTSSAVSYLKIRVQNGPTPVDLYMPLFAAL